MKEEFDILFAEHQKLLGELQAMRAVANHIEDNLTMVAQPEREPEAWMYPDALCDRSCLYVCTKGFTQFPECATTPPQRTWVGLTYEDMVNLQKDLYDAKGESVLPTTFAMAVEAKLKEKNT